VRVRIDPGSVLQGGVAVPGDKSIAHRWLILAATAIGSSRLVDLPTSLDVRSTARCLAMIAPSSEPALEAWVRNGSRAREDDRSTWNQAQPRAIDSVLEVKGEGRRSLRHPSSELDCGNSGTSMRLLMGVLSAAPLEATLSGDASLSRRPMERVAEPLRRMGATIETTSGHAPVVVQGGSLSGIDYTTPMASAQVKSAILLAGLGADGSTTVRQPVPTRDHTERALLALGGPVRAEGTAVTIEPFRHGGFEARCPGDPSSAAFLVGAAALTGSAITITDVGLNPTRTHFLEVCSRMGVATETVIVRHELGEPVGELRVRGDASLRPARVRAEELPRVIDEIPMLALLAAHAPGESRFVDAGELRVKESDRLSAVVAGIRELGGDAADEGDDLVVAGGGLAGGTAASGGDHRLAMAFAMGALAANRHCSIAGMEAADVSFPGFVDVLSALGANLVRESA
jgi:3-phosphoshikimate 1-carboxyvinyltransferase